MTSDEYIHLSLLLSYEAIDEYSHVTAVYAYTDIQTYVIIIIIIY